MEKEKFWQQCLDKIKNKITDQAFETWFKAVDIISLNKEEINLQVPNEFHYEWLESKYRHLIDEVIIEVGDHPKVVNYSVMISDKNINEIPKLNDQNVLAPVQYKKNKQLNERYTFNVFVEGKGNQFAKAAALSVAENPGQTPFNPLLIYSPPGLGKTHLLQSIGNQIITSKPNYKLIYITGERFMFDFINSIQKNKTSEFSNKYRDIDILLLDDAQFFKNKEQTQEQFFHLFNYLYQNGKQIILTSDRHPNKMDGFKERLISRFQSGLVIDIQPPDLETRIAILMNKAEHDQLEIPYEVMEFMASNIQGDIRTLEGALVNLLALSSLKKEDINLGLAKLVLEKHVGKTKMNQINVQEIIQIVALTMKVKEKEIVGKGRNMEVAFARQLAMFMSKKLINTSLANIGKQIGKRDHSTVIHACKTIEIKMKEDVSIKTIIDKIENSLKNK
ncbi:chromosomal replication initiator protein DnaA [bacterium]|nr:chromosomal replication initiator protein DnaA [bacterium]